MARLSEGMACCSRPSKLTSISRIARRGAHLPLSAGAWQRIAWGKARDERNRTIAGWLALRLALALARGEDPTISLLDTLGGIDSRRSQD